VAALALALASGFGSTWMKIVAYSGSSWKKGPDLEQLVFNHLIELHNPTDLFLKYRI